MACRTCNDVYVILYVMYGLVITPKQAFAVICEKQHCKALTTLTTSHPTEALHPLLPSLPPIHAALQKYGTLWSWSLCKSMLYGLLLAAFWNWAMVATARFLPVKIITDRDKIRAFAKWTSPLIRFVDPIIGEKVIPQASLPIRTTFQHTTTSLRMPCHTAHLRTAQINHAGFCLISINCMVC